MACEKSTSRRSKNFWAKYDFDLGRRFEDLERLEKAGFAYRTGWGRREDLLAITSTGQPLIASMYCRAFTWGSAAPGLHAVVVVGASGERVAVHDPFVGHGPKLLELATFLENWYQKRYGLLIPVI
jgi:hypothetical protein